MAGSKGAFLFRFDGTELKNSATPTWPYSTGWGYYSSGLGVLLLIVLLIVLLR